MGSTSISLDPLQVTFQDLERQAALMKTCSLLWKELSEHFSSLEQDLQKKSQTLKEKMETLDHKTKETLDVLEKRVVTIDDNVDVALVKVEECKEAALNAFEKHGREIKTLDSSEEDLLLKLRSFCTKMDSEGFWNFVIANKKDTKLLRAKVPLALLDCIDPAKFALEAISWIFPVDKRVGENKSTHDLGWACVLILESLVPVLADPVLGVSRPLVTPSVKEQAKEIVGTWKASVDEREGVESVMSPSVHTFLQHLVTFGIVSAEDSDLYRKLVVGNAWRKPMPKLAVLLGLADKMADIIEELISKGQQVDAVHFCFEAGLVDKFPPVPLLKSHLKDSKAGVSILDNRKGRPVDLVRKEQMALRSVIKCIEDYKLEAEFPPESLRKRLEQLEKVKVDKKKPVPVPANKRTRANNGGPMPPAKAGRLTNAYVSSFPTGLTFVRSPSGHSQYPAGVPQYPYDNRPAPPSMYGSRSPPGVRDPYAYPPEEVVPALPASYHVAPMNYPAYGGYGNGLAPGYQQAYY